MWKENVGWGKRARKNLNFDKMRSILLKSEDLKKNKKMKAWGRGVRTLGPG